MRTHCDCGKLLPPRLDPSSSNWGDWGCSCARNYCQDCGACLDENDECSNCRNVDDALSLEQDLTD